MSLNERRWVSFSNCDAPVAEITFDMPKLSRAAIDICGLGFFELYINEKKVSEDVLSPVCSQYEKTLGKNLLYPLSDTFSGCRVYFIRYDVTKYFNEGKNKIEVFLGNGYYNQKDRTIEGDFSRQNPMLCFELNYTDIYENSGIISSDEPIYWKPSYIKHNNIFYGEKHDYRDCENNFSLMLAETAIAPQAPLVLQKCPPDRVIRKITPKLIKNLGRKKIFDCGENITGWVSFKSLALTDTVTITFAEELSPDGTLDYNSTGFEETMKQLQKDEFILDGKELTCRPKFTWHGFRYFEFEGEATDITVEVVHADVLPKADFNCDNDLLNKIFDSFKRSMTGNMHCGIVSDCPHRERLGYTGDAQNTADVAMLVFEAEAFYRKFIDDIADTQDINTGHIQHTAPFFGGGGGPGGWGCAIVVIPYMHFKHYGDIEILKKYWHNMLKYIEYMESRCVDGLVSFEEKDGWCLGEWGTENDVEIPPEFVNTYFLVKSLILMQDIARILSKPYAELLSLEEYHKKAIKDNFYNAVSNTYCNGVNAADAFAADIGMANTECISALNQRYLNRRLDTGIFGTPLLIKTLFNNAFPDTAFKLLTDEGENTFYDHHIRRDSTTLWENWRNGSSHNHHMFGAVVACFFYDMLGIIPSEDFCVSPSIPTNLGFVYGSVKGRFGEISVLYEKKDGIAEFNIYVSKDGVFKYSGQTYKLNGGCRNKFKFEIAKD